MLTGQSGGRERPALILASASPRRADLVRRLGLAVRIAPSRAEEAALPLPAGVAERARALALAKAADIFRVADAPVLGADTLVALDGEALGKPGTPDTSAAMLRRLSGRRHLVYTGLALALAEPAPPGGRDAKSWPDSATLNDSSEAAMREPTPGGAAGPGGPLGGLRRSPLAGGQALSVVVASAVTFRRLDDAQIDAYVATGEPLDKAGAYGIQGRGGDLVARLDGCYTNVVGLPLCAVAALLALATGATVRCPGEARCRVAERGCWCGPATGAVPA